LKINFNEQEESQSNKDDPDSATSREEITTNQGKKDIFSTLAVTDIIDHRHLLYTHAKQPAYKLG